MIITLPIPGFVSIVCLAVFGLSGDGVQFAPGQFLAMLVRTLEIPLESGTAAWAQEAPAWLRPYLAAAVRSGIIADLAGEYDQPVSVDEAENMIRSLLDLDVETALITGEDAALTRGEAAKLLYQTAQLAREAPGLAQIRRQK